VTIKFKRLNATEVEIFRLPASAAVGDFLSAAESSEMELKSVVLGGAILSLSQKLADVARRGVLEIVRKREREPEREREPKPVESSSEKLKVKFTAEGSTRRYMVKVSRTALIGDFLLEASKVVTAVSVKVDDCFIPPWEFVAADCTPEFGGIDCSLHCRGSRFAEGRCGGNLRWHWGQRLSRRSAIGICSPRDSGVRES
jgi:hypothetical protein